MATLEQLTPGAKVGDSYEIVRLIGQGGMGAVFEARHLRLPKKVAIKVLAVDVAADSVAFARFKREAEVTSKLGHPHIVEVFDFNTLPSGAPYLVLELLDGESLASRLDRGPLALDPALRIGRQIASALASAHREQVVHRDLKPGNVFLCPREVDGVMADHVKVLDFGISKICGSKTIQTSDTSVVGTPRYMAPEQIVEPDSVDGRADQWALAAMMAEMLTGEPLFPGTVAEVVYKIAHGTASLERLQGRFPDRVVSSLKKALEKDRSRRYGDVISFMAECSGREAITARGGRPVVGFTDLEHAPTIVRPKSDAVAPAQPWKKVALVAAAGVALAVVGLLARPSPTPSTPTPTSTPSTPPPAVPAAAPDAAAPEPADAAAPPPDAAAPAAPPKKVPAAPPEPEAPLPPEVAQELDEAEASLELGDLSRAAFQANHSLMTHKSSRAWALLARVACKQGDLGKARAALFKVGPRDRPGVLRECKAHGVDLE